MSKPRASTLVSQLRLPKFWTSRGRHLPGSRSGGIELPRGMGKMTALHNISVIDVSIASGRAILEELKNLRQLRKLGVWHQKGKLPGIVFCHLIGSCSFDILVSVA